MNFHIDQTIQLVGGYLEIYKPPEKGVHHAAGADFAYGLADADADCCIILDEFGEQCAELHGYWGNTAFLTHLRPLLDWYQPFLVGERQVGLDVLRTLFDEGYWLYFQIEEAKKGRERRDLLGHHTSNVDQVTLSLRRAIATIQPDGTLQEPAIELHSEETISELGAYQFLPRAGGTLEGARDKDLSMSAPPGEHDDRVKALGLAWKGLRELPKYEADRPPPPPPKGSIGDMLAHAETFNPPKRHPSALLGK